MGNRETLGTTIPETEIENSSRQIFDLGMSLLRKYREGAKSKVFWEYTQLKFLHILPDSGEIESEIRLRAAKELDEAKSITIKVSGKDIDFIKVERAIVDGQERFKAFGSDLPLTMEALRGNLKADGKRVGRCLTALRDYQRHLDTATV